MTMPFCRHRGVEVSLGRFACEHPGLLIAEAGVDEAICTACEKTGIYCDNPPRAWHVKQPPQIKETE